MALPSWKWSGSDRKHNASNLSSALCKILLGFWVKFCSLSNPQRKKGKGWGRFGVFKGAITDCKSNTNGKLSSVPGSLQNCLLTLQQHHGCRSHLTSTGLKNQRTVTTRAMPVGFWTHSRTGTGEGQFARGQLSLMALSQIKSVITPENLPKVYAH